MEMLKCVFLPGFPVEWRSKVGIWISRARYLAFPFFRAPTKGGKADMIVGIYYNDDRAQYLDYVQPSFVFDPVVVFVAKDK
jgi:hypothetical protein